MSEVWLVVGVVGAVTIAVKAAGPVLVAGRGLPPRAAGIVGLLAPAVLAALVVTQTVGAERAVVVDERLAGVAAAAALLALRAPTLLAIVAAAVVAALLRAL